MIEYYNKDYIICDCGSIIKKCSDEAHFKSKKHVEYIKKMTIFKKNYVKEYMTCTCGCILRTQSIYTHRLSKKHKKKIDDIKNNCNSLVIVFD